MFGPALYESIRFVTDLMAYMTLEEKLGQLDLFHAPDDPALEQAIVAGRVGGVASGAHAQRWQTLATERSRLGIPLLLTTAPAAGVLSPLALAASWNEELARDAGAEMARAVIDRGGNAVVAPRLAAGAAGATGARDIAAGEPFLLAHLAAAFCRGAAGASADGRDAVMTIVSCPPEAGEGAGAAGRLLAHGARVAAIDGCGLSRDAPERIDFDGIMVAECARIRAHISTLFASTRARSELEAAERALAQGVLREDDIDAAARSVLTAKHRLGLFRHPHRTLTSAATGQGRGTPAERVRNTMVLLRNEAGLLPFSPVSDRVLVIGAPHHGAGAVAEALSRAGIGNTAAPGLAMRRADESWRLPIAGDPFAQALTRDAATRADFGVVVLEDRHFMPAESDSAWPTPGPALLALLRAIAPTGIRLVALIATAGPVDLADADQYFTAVLQCWTPTEGFEEALCDVFSGRAGPCGRMPVAAGRYAFGQGLGFGESIISGLKIAAGPEIVRASVTVRNEGSFATHEVIQVYRRTVDGAPRLIAFHHLDLAPGAQADVEIALDGMALGTIAATGRLEVPVGACEILVGKDQRRLLSAAITIDPDLAKALARGERQPLRLAG